MGVRIRLEVLALLILALLMAALAGYQAARPPEDAGAVHITALPTSTPTATPTPGWWSHVPMPTRPVEGREP